MILRSWCLCRCSPLYEAARMGDMKAMRDCLAVASANDGVSQALEWREPDLNWTALHVAVRRETLSLASMFSAD